MPHNDSQSQGSMADALSPLANKMRGYRSAIRPVSQVTVTLGNEQGRDVFADVRDDCLNWMANRAGRKLPEEAWKGKSFELEEVGAQRVGAVSIQSPQFWASRIDDADKNLAQRTWVTEIGLAKTDDGRILFGSRLICVTRGDDAPYERTIPGFVRHIIESKGALLDGRMLGSEPWLVNSEKDVDELVGILQSPVRTVDVVVFSLPENSTDPCETIVPALEVHQRTLGAAHVAILTGPASYWLTGRLGKEFSVFHQGVRTYLAGFNHYQDQPFSHPLGLPGRIATWEDGGAEGYARMLIDRALARSVVRPDREQHLPSYSTVRRFAAQRKLEQAKQEGSSEAELLAMAMEEVSQLHKALEEQQKDNDELLETAEGEREQALQASQQASARSDALMRQVEALEKRLESAGKKSIEIPIPDNFDNFATWCESYLSGYVDLHNRAFQGIKKSVFHDCRFVYRALLLLKNYYVTMRREPGEEVRQAYEEACRRLQLEETNTISDARLGEQGDTYIVNYAGRKRTLDRHLKNGTSKDQRYCFRLYFFWDQDSQQVVVGWLPSHLDTRQT